MNLCMVCVIYMSQKTCYFGSCFGAVCFSLKDNMVASILDIFLKIILRLIFSKLRLKSEIIWLFIYLFVIFSPMCNQMLGKHLLHLLRFLISSIFRLILCCNKSILFVLTVVAFSSKSHYNLCLYWFSIFSQRSIFSANNGGKNYIRYPFWDFCVCFTNVQVLFTILRILRL